MINKVSSLTGMMIQYIGYLDRKVISVPDWAVPGKTEAASGKPEWATTSPATAQGKMTGFALGESRGQF